MNNDLPLHDPPGRPDPAAPPLPDSPVDAGSRALSEALRGSFAIVKFLLVALIAVFVFSGVFKVEPGEQAVVLFLGKPVNQSKLLGPGLHCSMPYPIGDHIKVSIGGIQQVESSIGWYAQTREQRLAHIEPPAGPTLNPMVDGYLLTADRNIVHGRATLSYRITDPIRYLFEFANSSNAVRNVLDNALLQTASRFTVDDILTRDGMGFTEAVRRRADELARAQELGIQVEQCVVEDSKPPRQVADAFKAVASAANKRDEIRNSALSYENEVTNRAGSDAKSLVNLAQRDRSRYVSDTASRAKEFQDLLPSYQSSPELFVQQRRTETLGRVFTNVHDKIFVAESADGNPRETRYQFNRETPKPKAEEPKP
jgi:membrane protease subunit HflK